MSTSNQEVLSSPGSNGLYIEDREELNLGLLDDSEEEKSVSTLSDLVNTNTTRKMRPVLSEARQDGDPRLANMRKLSRMSSGCVIPAAGMGSTPDSTSSSSSSRGCFSQAQFKTLAGQHLGKRRMINTSLATRSPAQSTSSPKLSEFPPKPVFNQVTEDRQIKDLEEEIAAMEEKRKLLKQKKEVKLNQQMFDYQTGGHMEAVTGVGPLALREIQKQTRMLLNMQKNLMMEKQRFEEEKRRQEQERKYQELQDSVERLQRQLQAKQGVNPAGSIKDRVGPKNKLGVSVFSRIKKQETPASYNGDRPVKRKFTGSDQGQRKKKNINNNDNKLPDDLVLTNITDQGPKKARARIDYHSLPEDLVLTDLTEEGPKPRLYKPKEDDDKVVMEEEEDEEDLDRYLE